MRKQEGITIVSLVVTIIVLIILATVTINATLGENGIITIARQAKENLELAQIEEQTELNELYMSMGTEDGTSGGISYDAIAKLIEFKKVISEAITNEGVSTDETDSLETMAENIAKIKSSYTYPAKTTSDLKAGNYIKYNTGVTSVGEKGVITCRVLYEASSEYGLQIISNENVGNSITLGGEDWSAGKTSYNEAVEKLNSAAEDYLNEEYATDARCVGSIPIIDENGKMINKNLGATKTIILPISTWEGTYTRPTGWVSNDTGCYNTDKNHKTDLNQMKVIGIEKTGANYWLASRVITNDTSACYFRIYNMDSEGEVNYNFLCSVTTAGKSYGRLHTFGLRPCFSLKSNLKITGGDGTTEETAYTIANS